MFFSLGRPGCSLRFRGQLQLTLCWLAWGVTLVRWKGSFFPVYSLPIASRLLADVRFAVGTPFLVHSEGF